MKDMRYVRELLEQGKRADGRALDKFRKVDIEINPYEKPEGCAIVTIGKSKVMAGVKMNVGEPFSDRPDEGVLMVNAELSPLASPDFETGPPKVESIELARVVDRGIRESKAMDVKKLCIKEGEKVWMIFVDVHILNHDGNLIDAAGLAAIAALLNARFPEYDKKTELVDNSKKTKNKLPLQAKPVPVTVSKFGEQLFVDANLEEQGLVKSSMVITTDEDGNLCALQKLGTEGLSEEDILKMWELSVKKGKELRKLLS